MKLTLPLKLGLLTFFIALLGVVGISLFSYRNTDDLLQEFSIRETENDLERESILFRSSISALKDDLRFISESPAIIGIMRAYKGGGYDDRENMTYAMWRKRLISFFKTIINAREAYCQIRFVGAADGGKEIVRVDRRFDKGKKIVVIPEEELQPKSHRDYFKEIASLKPGSFYYSKINLNVEQKKIAIPHQPVLRTALSIVDENDVFFGFIIINVDFNTMARIMRRSRPDLFYFITNEYGDYIAHPNKDKCFGFDLGERRLAQNDYQFNGFFDNAVNNDGHLRIVTPSRSVGIVTRKINLDLTQPERFLILGAVASFDVIKAKSAEFRNKIIIIVSIVGVILTLFTALASRILTSPIRKLTKISNRIASGEEDLEIPVKGRDEVAILSASFNKMLSHLSKSRKDLQNLASSLEDKVEERTKELMISNKAINASMNGIVIINMDGNIIDLNPSTLEIMRYLNKGELLGKSIYNLWQNDDNAVHIFQDILKTGSWHGELTAKRRDNTFFQAQLSSNKITEKGNSFGFIISFQDITESRHLEEQNRTILQIALDGFVIIGSGGNILEVNEAYCKMTGYDKEELVNMEISDIEFSEKPHGDAKHAQRIVESGCDRFETKYRRKDGKTIDVDVSSNYLIVDGGRFFSFVRDITDRKKAEEQLRMHRDNLEDLIKKRTYEIEQINKNLSESVELFHTLADNAPVGIWRSDENGGCIYVNKRCSEIINLPLEKAKGAGWAQYIHPDDKPRVFNEWINAVKANKPFLSEYRFKLPSGSLKWVYVQAAAEKGENGNVVGYVGTLTDITERKIAEEKLKKSNERLLHSEKLSAIGKLSASIAHEFNNPICGVRNILETMFEKEPGETLDETDKKQVGMAVKECNRMADLIKKLQDFHRPSSGETKLVNIQEIIEDVLLICKKELKNRKIILEKHFKPIPQIKAVPDQIKQVILNLIQNASDAMHDIGGKITITTEYDAPNALMHFKDNGSGISEMDMKSIFEPFFTTKPAVKGTGLGLSISHGIINKHGGEIKVESQLGKGTTFTITLPVGDSV